MQLNQRELSKLASEKQSPVKVFVTENAAEVKKIFSSHPMSEEIKELDRILLTLR